MIFSSYEFIFLFLPIVLVLYYLMPVRARTLYLTLASYLFYGWWDYRFCGLMLLSTVIDFIAGKKISAATEKRAKLRWVAVSAVSNLSLLGFFKYFDMFAKSVNSSIAFFSSSLEPSIPLLNLVLPVGISFYTFQSMSYAIDLYKGRAKQARSFSDFACYVSLFPQLVAGPIVRYHELAEQLVTRTHSIEKIARGGSFFIVGLAKKVLVADAVAPLVPLAFNGGSPGFIEAWAGVLAYTVQIYFDFSGYSDMAVGLGLMFGFQLPQNFNSPYKSISITDFWRRWHISLSNWLRDYLYIPLGGNRLGDFRTYVNLSVTMLLGGLWHGASWTFVLWGLFHGVLLALERLMGKAGILAKQPLFIQRTGTFILVMIGWVLFRAESMGQVGAVYRGMVGLSGFGEASMLGISASVLALPLSLLFIWLSKNSWEVRHEGRVWWVAYLVVLFVASAMAVLVNSASPFLYFQF